MIVHGFQSKPGQRMLREQSLMRYAAEKPAIWRNPPSAAQRAYEALDHFVIAKTGIDTSRPGANDEVLSSPLVQAELSRQRRDIDELLARDREDIARLHGECAGARWRSLRSFLMETFDCSDLSAVTKPTTEFCDRLIAVGKPDTDVTLVLTLTLVQQQRRGAEQHRQRAGDHVVGIAATYRSAGPCLEARTEFGLRDKALIRGTMPPEM